MATDLVLAVCHHLLMLSVAAVLLAELILVRRGLSGTMAVRVAAMARGDGW